MINEKVATELKGSARGEVILPDDGRYEDARKVYNAMIDKRPAVVVRCTGVADVIAAVKAARAAGLSVAIRGGGHSVPGFGTADDALADGSFVTTNKTASPDLFWALRGGGGNFGVVTSFQYKLQPVKNITGGPMFFEVEDAEKVMRTFDEYISRAPRELGAFFAWQIAPPLPFIPEDRHGDTLCVLVTCWAGPPTEAEAAIAPLREAAAFGAPFLRPRAERGQHPMGERLLQRPRTPRPGGRLHQLRRGRRHEPRPSEFRPELRPAVRGQIEVRFGERVPAQPEHHAGLARAGVPAASGTPAHP